MGPMAIEIEDFTFELHSHDSTFRLLLFHVKLAELLAHYPSHNKTEPYPQEAFLEAWQKGIGEYKRLYEKALGFGSDRSYDNRVQLLNCLFGYENWHNKYGMLPLFQVGQNSAPKESRYHVRKELIARHAPRCYLCHRAFRKRRGRMIFEAHHIVPEVFGGKTTVENMVPLCKKCYSNIKSPLQEMNAEISRMIAARHAKEASLRVK